MSLAGDASSRKYSDAGSLVGKADNRLFKNPETKRKHIEALETFFSAHRPSIELSPKAFVEPTGKDFAAMWTEITRALNFKRSKQKKLEDHVADCLKTLRYPFTLSKSSLGTPGATHVWPNIRAALVWLINLKTLFDQIPARETEGKDELDDVSITNHSIAGYRAFMDLDDSALEELTRSKSASIEKQEQALRDSIAASKAKNDQVMATSKEYRNKRSAKNAMEQSLEETKRDKQRMESKLSQTQKAKAQCEKKIAEKETDLASCQKNMEKILQEITVARHQVQNQKYSKEDVERLLNEKSRLEHQLETLRSHSTTVKKEVFDLEGKIQEVKFDIQQKVHESNTLATRLKMMPASAKRARGVDFSIEFDKNVPDHELECPRSFKSVIQPGIERIKTEVEKKIVDLKEELTSVEKELEDGRKQISKIQGQHRLDEQHIQQINQEIEDVNAAQENLKSEVAGKLDRIEKEILGVQERCVADVQESEADENDAKKMAEESAKKWNKELSEFRSAYLGRLEDKKAIFQKAKETVAQYKKNCYAVVEQVEEFKKKVKESHD
ncbi:hypothetical protein BSKO_06957 [Bryopsis sp. KO-2023]|nr:hypothetical protein BSKO_06957 [Bryopsis sp. KO-2023]